MIAGPSMPRTVQGLEAMVSGQSGVLEWGLTVVALDLDFGEVGRATALARDALGAPVLVFVDDPGAPSPVSANAARVHAHLVANEWLLQRLFPHRLPQALREALRVLVLGFSFDPLGLATLRALALPDVTVLEVHEWAVGGEPMCSARTVFTRPARTDATFMAPSAIGQRDAAELAGELLAWLARLDADVVLEGDRFSRHVRARGRPLCTLVWHDGAAWVLLPDGPRFVLHARADAMAAMDAIMQAFAQTLPAAREPVFDGAAGFGALRQSLRDTRLSRDELRALQTREDAVP